jgi:hypothetical protein
MERYGRSARIWFAQAVEETKRELMARDPRLTELEAHRQAIKAVEKKDPGIARRYRQDVQSL